MTVSSFTVTRHVSDVNDDMETKVTTKVRTGHRAFYGVVIELRFRLTFAFQV